MQTKVIFIEPQIRVVCINLDHYLVLCTLWTSRPVEVERQHSKRSRSNSHSFQSHIVQMGLFGANQSLLSKGYHFLAVQNSSLGDLVTHSPLGLVTHATFTFDIQRATLETYDLWDIWSEWQGNMSWPWPTLWQLLILLFITIFTNFYIFFGSGHVTSLL